MAKQLADKPKQPAKQAQERKVIATESLVRSCGHAGEFQLFANDTYEQQRRAKFQKGRCVACGQEAQRKHNEEQKAANPPKPKQPPQQPIVLKGRLPHGARFDVVYDAENQEWSGTLTINGLCFSEKRHGVFKLLARLDGMWRREETK